MVVEGVLASQWEVNDLTAESAWLAGQELLRLSLLSRVVQALMRSGLTGSSIDGDRSGSCVWPELPGWWRHSGNLQVSYTDFTAYSAEIRHEVTEAARTHLLPPCFL